MARDFYLNGPCLVFVQGGFHWFEEDTNNLQETMAVRQELGLTSDAIRISPRFYREDIRADSFGPNAPAEVMWNLADVQISMNLIHYDPDWLGNCMQDAAAGGNFIDNVGGELGELAAASALMGNGFPLLASGNHFI